jgi:hypothetical protein
MVRVKHDELTMAFDYVSSAAPIENSAYVSLETGKIVWIGDSVDAFAEDIPDDIETSDRYVAVPHKNDLDLGKALALRFVQQELPAHYERVDGFFHRRGAYAHFKDLLARESALERWHAFEASSVDKALRQWCSENGLTIVET